MTKRVVLVRHDHGPEDDRVTSWLARNGITAESRRPFAGDELGQPDEEIIGSVVFGGKFDAYAHDQYPFLRDEARWIEACMRKGVPLLGICQGAQQIAHVLGAHVGPAPDDSCEFGYYEVTPTNDGRAVLPQPIHVAQSHYHTFGIPQGAKRLAFSALFPNQAFSYGENVCAFQFHAEVTPEGFRRWQQSSTNYARPGAQSRAEQDQLMGRFDATQDAWFQSFLDGFFSRGALWS